VARRISGALRDYDVVGRLGQGSFLLLLPDADVLGGRHALERVVASVRSRPISAVHASIAVRISVGVVQAEAGRADLDDAIERAYLALGTARAQGSEDALTRAANLTALPSAAPPPEAHESHAA
jgi:diguanylate cyclase (GGDEF)-like protein